MSLTVWQRSTNGPESWYGEPQHETHVDDPTSIEFERYGEPNHEQPSGSFEFVSGIEYCPWQPIGEPGRSTRSKRAERPTMTLRMGGD